MVVLKICRLCKIDSASDLFTLDVWLCNSLFAHFNFIYSGYSAQKHDIPDAGYV